MKKLWIIIIILSFGIVNNVHSYSNANPQYRWITDFPEFTDNGNGTFSRNSDPNVLKDFYILPTGSDKNFDLKDFPYLQGNLIKTCPNDKYKIRLEVSATGIRADNTTYNPYHMKQANTPTTANIWLYNSWNTTYNMPVYNRYAIRETCYDYPSDGVDTDGDGVIDSNDPEPYNPNVWTETTCIDPEPGCHAGIYSEQAFSGTGSVKIIESVYDENGKMVWAKIEFTNEPTCRDGSVGEICVQGTQTMIIGDENIIDKLSIEGKGTTVTAPIEFETFDEFKSYTAKNLDGSIGTELVDTLVQTPGGYKHYGDWTNDPGAVAATEALDYSGQYQAMNQNLIGVGQRSEKQISQLDRIANSLKSIDSGITKQGSEIKNALAGIGTGTDGTGTGDEGYPWGDPSADPYSDPESQESQDELAKHNVPDNPDLTQTIQDAANLSMDEIPEEFRTKFDWGQFFTETFNNNPITDITDGIDLQVTGGTCSESVSTSFGTISLSLCEMQPALASFGQIILSLTTFTSFLMLIRRG